MDEQSRKREASDGTPFPFLVQRVDFRKRPRDKTGIDRHFSFDYMGSSEFEWGALPKALKAIRAEECESWKPTKITVDGMVAWFLGDPKLLLCATEFFADQLHDFSERKIDLKERSRIRDTYLTDKDGYFRHDGWWALDAAPPWMLFRKKEHAELWMKDLDNKARVDHG